MEHLMDIELLKKARELCLKAMEDIRNHFYKPAYFTIEDCYDILNNLIGDDDE
jgi:hypothetical protein